MLLRDVGSCCAKFETGQTFRYMQTDEKTHQQCWEVLTNNVASVYTGLNLILPRHDYVHQNS